MKCIACGSQLVEGGRACPNCGAATPSVYARSGASASDPTAVSGPTAFVAAPPPSTSPSSDPYNSAASGTASPYSVRANPYDTTPPPPPVSASYPLPLPPVRNKTSIGAMVGVGLLVLILLGGGVFAYQYLARTPGTTTNGSTTAASSVTLSADAAQKLYAQNTSGTPVLDDALAGPSNFGWDHSADQSQNASCVFMGGAYHSKAQPTYFSPCYANASNFGNFVFQAQMTVLSGHSGGLVFRADGKNDNGYYFRVSTDGTCLLKKLTNAGQSYENLVSLTSPAVHKGVNQPNLLSVIAQGNTISLFVNKQYIGGFSDSTYQSGEIGVYADSDSGVVEASFSKAQVWKLS